MYLADITTTITNFVTSLYVHAGLAGILLAMAIESCCIPLPSEIVMPLAGVMLATGKILSGIGLLPGLVLIALVGSLGCVIGSTVAYGIGYAGGRPLMLKYGRYVLISQHDADKADAFFKKYGSATAFFSRLLPVVRTYISLPAGIAKMPFGKFIVYSFLGSFPWCLLLAYVGTLIGGNLTKLAPIFHDLDIVIIVLVVALVALYIWRHIRNDRKARAALAAAPSAPVASQQPLMQHGWGQPSQQGWGQQPPSQPLQQPPQYLQGSGPLQQNGWGQSPQQLPPQQAWNGQPIAPPQQAWGQGQPIPPQPQQPQQPFPSQGWGQPVPPQQQGWGRAQPPSQEQWPAPDGNNSHPGQW
ncbi:MAG TPA: DedA family protein [Ktedonobacteraceae bacterium]|nr:DedA family protein [Ktedonobacteraceae bacterium]